MKIEVASAHDGVRTKERPFDDTPKLRYNGAGPFLDARCLIGLEIEGRDESEEV